MGIVRLGTESNGVGSSSQGRNRRANHIEKNRYN
jgi:hypothetical protein